MVDVPDGEADGFATCAPPAFLAAADAESGAGVVVIGFEMIMRAFFALKVPSGAGARRRGRRRVGVHRGRRVFFRVAVRGHGETEGGRRHGRGREMIRTELDVREEGLGDGFEFCTGIVVGGSGWRG